MSRRNWRPDADGGIRQRCHPDEWWSCAGCLRVLCRRCDGIPGPDELCWECTPDDEDPMDGAA